MQKFQMILQPLVRASKSETVPANDPTTDGPMGSARIYIVATGWLFGAIRTHSLLWVGRYPTDDCRAARSKKIATCDLRQESVSVVLPLAVD